MQKVTYKTMVQILGAYTKGAYLVNENKKEHQIMLTLAVGYDDEKAEILSLFDEFLFFTAESMLELNEGITTFFYDGFSVIRCLD